METENKIEEFIVTARKWRPQKFADIIGQEHVTVTLKNAIKTERIHHAYLFSGPRGVGKTTSARILARALNCLRPIDSEPCNECDSCLPIYEGRSLDVIEIDGASNNSVDDIRKLRENSKYPPSLGKYKLYIIDEVHMLSTSAFNALLKTLEEPPQHLIFVFATTEVHKVPATILSRCQRFDFRRIEIESIVNQLRVISERDGVQIDDESLFSIAKKADGSMRDGQSLYDQVVAFCGKTIDYALMSEALNLIDADFYFRISNAAKEHNILEMFNISREVIRRGYNLQDCLSGLLEHYRNILSIKITGDTNFIDSSKAFHQKYISEAQRYEKEDLLRLMQHININEQAMRYASQPKLKFEMTLVQLASMDEAIELGELINELKSLSRSDSDISILRQSSTSYSSKTISDKQSEKKVASKSKDKKYDETFNKSIEEVPKTVQDIPITNSAKVDSEYLRSRWDEFLSKYAVSANKLSMLKQVKPVFMNGEIILKGENGFAVDNLLNKRDNLEQYLSEFYGTKIKAKIIVGKDLDVSEPIQVKKEDDNKLNEVSTSMNHSLEQKENTEQLHIAEEKIIELFGGRKVSSDD